MYKVTYGGWYQRTTLHLTEVFNYLAYGHSDLKLSKAKLEKNREAMNLKSVHRMAGNLEYLSIETYDDIKIHYYEDGLYVLYMDTTDVLDGKKKLEDYYHDKYAPAVSYIFSLGAPTPKILANIKIIHPVVASIEEKNPDDFKVEENKYGHVYEKITADDMAVYKTKDYIFVAYKPAAQEIAKDLVETQIFFREFKDQLLRYLNIHRKVWEEISEIRESKKIAGKDVETVRNKLDSYQKTINLINNRLNQMGFYVNTRKSLAGKLKIEETMITFFQYKFDVLNDSLNYMKEVWGMTKDYLASAIQVVLEVKNQTMNVNISSLRTITTIGVIASMISFMTAQKWPKITNTGIFYFISLVTLTALVNYLVFVSFRIRRYKISINEREKDI